MGGPSNGITRGAGMSVRRIRADSDMNGDRRRIAVGLREKARAAVSGIGDCFKMPAERFAKPKVALECPVHFATGLFSGPEAAVRKHRFHIFAGLASDGD